MLCISIAPLKGLPSRFAIRGNNSISQIIRGIGTRPPGPVIPGRKDGGGIKLLDIADQPATHTQKKRRRMLGKFFSKKID